VSLARLHNTLKQHRERLGLSQAALAERVGVSRQAILAIEAGRSVPATSLGLLLAQALGCRVEDLFRLDASAGLPVDGPGGAAGERVALGEVGGRWVAHPLRLDASVAADGLLESAHVARPLADPERLQRNVLVAGCAPLLGALSQRVAGRFSDARVRWLSASSRHALDLLARRQVHVAGLHLTGGGGDNADVARATFPGQRLLVVNLTRWRQGLVVPAGNPAGLTGLAELGRPGLRIAQREVGSGAHKLVAGALGGDAAVNGPLASGHAEVALLVRAGAADVGVAIESEAIAAGLDFVPLSEERFDLVIPAAWAEVGATSRVVDAIDDAGFRADVDALAGYDGGVTGHATTVDAA